MEYLPYFYIFIFLSLSAFFSGSETALFALNPLQIKKIKENKVWLGSLIAKLLKRPKTLLITIITGNLFVNIGLSNYFGFFLDDAYGRKLPIEEKNLLILLYLTPMLVLFGEIFPKIVSIKFSKSIAPKVAPLLYFIGLLLFPIRLLVSFIIDFFMGSLNLDQSANSTVTKKEISAAVDSATNNGLVSEPEGKRVLNVLESAETKIMEIMTPLEDMLLLAASTPLALTKKKFILSKKQWAYIYQKEKNKITSVVKLSQAIPVFFKVQKVGNIAELALKIPSILETLTLDKALDLFLSSRTEAALVIDEYGETIGSITLKELQSRLFIRNEDKQKNIFKQIQLINSKTGEFKIQGSLHIEDFNRLFRLKLKSKYVESIGGYIIEKLKGFPRPENKIRLFQDYELTNFIIKNYTISSFTMKVSPEIMNYYLQKTGEGKQ